MPYHFTTFSLIQRLVLALFGVFATYNPSGHSYFHWVQQADGLGSLRVLVGVGLVIFYVVYLRATLRSLGPIGIGLTTALFGSIAWLLTQWHIIDLSVADAQSTVSLAILAAVLGVGMSWSGIRYRISGQYDSEEVGNGAI